MTRRHREPLTLADCFAIAVIVVLLVAGVFAMTANPFRP